jgi:hypothetical protein
VPVNCGAIPDSLIENELFDDCYTLGQRAYPLLQVIAIDPASCSVTLSVPKGVTPWSLDDAPRGHPLLHRWDPREAVNAQGALAVAEGAPIALEDGTQVSFEPGGLYVTGDCWLVPARVAGNGRLDWPMAGAALPPRGRHRYAVLGVTADNGSYDECCCRFDSLCQLPQAGQGRLAGKPAGSVAAPAVLKKARAKVARKKAAKADKPT